MNDAKYIGMDVHTATISAAVRDSSGNLVMEATLETNAETILEFVHGLRGSLRVSFEEGTVCRLVARSFATLTLAKCWFVIRVKMPC